MKKITKVLSLLLAIVLVGMLFSGCGSSKKTEAGLYKDGKLVKSWNKLLKEIGYTDFDGKTIKCKSKSANDTYTSYFSMLDKNEYENYDLILPDGLTSIGDGAFASCTELRNITLPNSLTSIGDRAFYCCSLSNITFPDSLTNIGEAAFLNCSKLKNLSLPNSLTKTGYRVFASSGITNLKIPGGIKIFGRSFDFSGMNFLANITIEDGVEEIENFYLTSGNLEKIIIPDSVTYIEPGVFHNCENLTIYGSKGSYAEQFAIENNIAFSIND